MSEKKKIGVGGYHPPSSMFFYFLYFLIWTSDQARQPAKFKHII